MKKAFNVLIIILSPSIFAANSNAKPPSQCHQLIDEKCENIRDEIYQCSKSRVDLVYKQGEFLSYPEDVFEDLKNRKSELIQLSQKYGVSPRIIASTVLAANTIKPKHWGEYIANPIHRWGLIKPSSTANPGFYGIGRIIEDRIETAETIVQKHNPERAARTKIQARDQIETNDEGLEYTVALLKNNIDIYKSKGIDISENPAIAASTYFLHDIEGKASRRAARNEQPQMNDMGIVASCHQHLVDELLGSETSDNRSELVPSLGQTGKTEDRSIASGEVTKEPTTKKDSQQKSPEVINN